MRIELRDEHRRRIGRISAETAARPTRVIAEPVRARLSIRGIGQTGPAPSDQPPGAADGPPAAAREVFLNWDSALDDAGRLRRCIVCACPDLYVEKAFPQITALVVVLAFIGAIVGGLGLATNLPVLVIMAGVLVLDVAILIFSRRRLVCYRCRSSYHDLPIARYHRPWDRSKVDRYPPRAPPAVAGPPPAAVDSPPRVLVPANPLSIVDDEAEPASIVKEKNYFA